MEVRSLFGLNSAEKKTRWTNQPTDGPTDQPTDGRTDPLIESRVHGVNGETDKAGEKHGGEVKHGDGKTN